MILCTKHILLLPTIGKYIIEIIKEGVYQMQIIIGTKIYFGCVIEFSYCQRSSTNVIYDSV